MFENSKFSQNSALEGLILQSVASGANISFINCTGDGSNTQFDINETKSFRG